MYEHVNDVIRPFKVSQNLNCLVLGFKSERGLWLVSSSQQVPLGNYNRSFANQSFEYLGFVQLWTVNRYFFFRLGYYSSLNMACIQWAQPEQDGQSHRTWSNVVENSTKQHCSDNKAVFNSRTAEEFIPLETGGKGVDLLNQSTSKDGKLLKRKLSNLQQNNNSHVSSLESSYCTPWKSKNYTQDPTGFVSHFPRSLSLYLPSVLN